MIYVDAHTRLIRFEELFRGTVNESGVHPREVARKRFARMPSVVILAHNHPSGDPEPSLADIEVTRRLKQALALLDVQVLDHIIVGDRRCVSFEGPRAAASLHRLRPSRLLAPGEADIKPRSFACAPPATLRVPRMETRKSLILLRLYIMSRVCEVTGKKPGDWKSRLAR